jgi:hypothetical protein
VLFLNLPNIITIIRLIIYAGLLVLFLFVDAANKIWVFIVIVANNHILDSVDGIVARKYNMTTASGKFLDHAGDRMCKSFLMCTLSYLGIFPWFLTAFHIGFKNQFFEIPSYFTEGFINNKPKVKQLLPFYYFLTYNKIWIEIGIFYNYAVWTLLVFDKYSYQILSYPLKNGLLIGFFLHTLIRSLPIISVYNFLHKNVKASGI